MLPKAGSFISIAATRDDAHRRVRLVGFLDDGQLLCRAPAPPFRPRKDLHLMGGDSHSANITPTQLGSVDGLPHEERPGLL